MNKTIFFFIFSLFILSIVGCKKRITRKVISLQQSNFYNNEKSSSNDSILIQLSNGFDKAFKLSPIEKSIFKNELRIYFINPFTERFFIEAQSEDSVHAQIYNCKTKRKSDDSLKIKERDSLFMDIGGLIKLDFKEKAKSFIYFDSLPTLKIFYITDTAVNVLDDGSTYFYEIKKDNRIKKGLIDKPLATVHKNSDALYVEKFIRYINEKYTFHFWDTWSNITISFTFKEK